MTIMWLTMLGAWRKFNFQTAIILGTHLSYQFIDLDVDDVYQLSCACQNIAFGCFHEATRYTTVGLIKSRCNFRN